MNCTCKEWEKCAKENALLNYYTDRTDGTNWNICPWCGSPLLPDPVEKTEWYAGNYKFASEQEASDYANKHAPIYGCSYTLKSITTIERVIKIVRPK